MQNILLGITGSIAAYKTPELVRQLKKTGADVRVVLTSAAAEIVSPMTLQVLSQHEVRQDLFSHEDEAKIDHISLARFADAVLIAPATANFLSKLAHGLCDDLLTTLCVATQAPIYLAPAMNQAMWANPIVQENVAKLKAHGVHFLGPDSGFQACGETGQGRMLAPEAIVAALCKQTAKNQPLKGKHILITAGATIERIDPVRYLTNDSSGKMGCALAKAAHDLGAQVTLVLGKVSVPPPADVHCVEALSADAMLEAVLTHVKTADWFIAAAAVADYKVAEVASQKIKKSGQGLTLSLIENPDILREVCALPDKPLTIGFAAETDALLENARSKRLRKGADFIVANPVGAGKGFFQDDNEAVLISEQQEVVFEKMSKSALAYALLETILAQTQSNLS